MANCPKTGEVCPTLTGIEDGLQLNRELCASEGARQALMQFSVEVLNTSQCEGIKHKKEYDADEVFFIQECGSNVAEKLLEVIAIAADVDIEDKYYTEQRKLVTEEV